MIQNAEELFALGRRANDLEYAEAFVRDFIRWTRSESGRRGSDRQADFDLYLPWLMECVSNQRVSDEGLLSMLDIDRLYMEAAASLATKGLLRMGPRKVTSPNPADAYGKGFSLTYAGDEWLSGAA